MLKLILRSVNHDQLLRQMWTLQKYRPSYKIVSANDCSFYTVFRGDFDSYNECKQKRDELYVKRKYFIPDNEKKILTTKKNTIHYGKGRVYPPITAYRLV